MRGRRPQPESIKDQKAAVRSRHVKADSAQAAEQQQIAVPAAGQPPSWVKGEALVIWNRLAPTLRLAKLLTDADTLTFARYCRNYARWLKAEREIDKSGETYLSESQWGKLKRINPSFLIADRLERQLLAAEDRFGLNPAERQRIMVARATTGVPGDLFSAPVQPQPGRRPGDPASQPTEPAQPSKEPVGFLN